jgi:hypothetical protein
MPIQFIGCPDVLYEAASETLGFFSALDADLYDRKLVPAQASNGINLADARAQSVSDGAKQLVTHRVPQGIVDLFEIIKVQTKHGKTRPPASLPDGLFNALGEQ